MIGFLTTESATPILHMQTMFGDSWETLCKLTSKSYEGMTTGERADVRLKTAQQLNLEFVLEWSAYFPSKREDRSRVPEWASHTALLKPLTSLAPWMAAWNRTVRKMVRLKQREHEHDGDTKSDTPLAEVFFGMTQQASMMDRATFQAWANQSGYPTSTTNWLSKQMSIMAKVLLLISLSCRHISALGRFRAQGGCCRSPRAARALSPSSSSASCCACLCPRIWTSPVAWRATCSSTSLSRSSKMRLLSEEMLMQLPRPLQPLRLRWCRQTRGMLKQVEVVDLWSQGNGCAWMTR